MVAGVAFTANMVQPKPAAQGAFYFQKIFGDGDFLAAGQLIIPPGSTKPTYGYPILHPNIVRHGPGRPCYTVNIFDWPIHSKTGRPVISSERTFMIEWGASSLSVSGYSLGQRRYVCDVRAPLRAYVMWSCMWRCRARASARARQLCPTRHISTDCRNDVRAQQRARDRSCVTYQHTH